MQGDPGAATATPRRRAGRLASGTAIKDAAARLFVEKGYLGTSMDDVAAAAKVSKQTIYTHFASKEQLFEELVLANASRVDDFTAALRKALLEGGDLNAALRETARMYLRFVIRPEVLRLRRLVIGEAARFPDLARTYYERVPGRVYSALAEAFEALTREGRLRTLDPTTAAHHFVWLTLGMPLDRGMFELEPAVTGSTLEKVADDGVRAFLAAYSG